MSSWLRSAVNKAVEVGNNNSLIRNVVHQAEKAVAEGAKLIQDRIGGRNFRSFKHAVKRLEEASVSCRGRERAELMRRWIAVLKEIENSSFKSSDDNKEPHQLVEEARESPRRQSMVLYYDPDMGGEPMNFRDVFLYSQALEGISICMILEAPNEDEVSLLLELFGLCLTGGKEVHNAIVSSIQDLAKVFSSYEDEVLVKREELLQFAEGAITGLKVNADVKRVDEEVFKLKKELDELSGSHNRGSDGLEAGVKESAATTIEALKVELARIRICSRIKGLLLKKKYVSYGDTAEIHSQKVDKLKILLESLSNSSTKAEKRISENRLQKEEALKFRVSKESEVSEIEKELAAEISGLEKQRDELEAQLKKVNDSLSVARARLYNVTEERDQFFKANEDIVVHLKTKEDELERSVGSCRVESDILRTWINFLEDTWSLRCSHVEAKDKETSAELEKHENYFTNLVTELLSSYEKELKPAIDRIGKFAENLKSLSKGSSSDSNVETSETQMLSPRTHLETEYLEYESKIITTFSVVDHMKEQFYAQQGKISSKENPKIKEQFDSMEKLRAEFESVERPTLDMENPNKESDTPVSEKSQETVTSSTERAPKEVEAEKNKDPQPQGSDHTLDPEDELAKLESEFGNVDRNYTSEEIGEWEFDELERDLKLGDSSGK